MAMESPDRNSQSSAGDIQGSPLFNFLCSLSPIKPVKSARVAQTYSEISFPPPPAVFVSPGVSAQKASNSFQRHQCASRAEEAEAASEIAPTTAQKEVKHVLVSATQRVQRLRSVRKAPKTQSFASPCSSPSKLVEEYLADPAEDEVGTEEDNPDVIPDSSNCQIGANRCDMSYEHLEAMQLSTQGEVVLTKESSTQDAHGSNVFSEISLSTCIPCQTVDHNTDDLLDFHHQEAADLEFLMSEDVDESNQEACIDGWRTVTSSRLSELSAAQVEGYIASLRGIVDEEDEETGVLPTHLETKVIGDSILPVDNLETEPGPKGTPGVGACKTLAPHQRGARRRCLDFEVSEGLMQSETSMLSVKPMQTNLDKRQVVSSCGAEANRALLVLKKRVSATLGTMNNGTMQRLNVSTDNVSRKESATSIKMTCATTVNIKVSRCSPLMDIDSRHPCAKTSPAGMPSGIGLHLNSLTSSMPCPQVRETDGTGSLVTSMRPGNTLSGGMISSKMQGSPVESTQRCLLPLNPGKHTYAGTSTESRQGLTGLPLETRLDDFEVQSECSDQDIESSKSAICVHSGSLATRQQVQDIVPLNVLNKRPSPLGRKRVLLQDRAYQGEMEGAEDSIQSPYSPKKKRRTSSTAEKSGDSCKRCNCKKSKCLKLYCECFAAGVYCVDSCTCQGCFNKPEFEETVMDTRQQIESRNPLAFAPKIIRTIESSPTKRDESRDTPASARHKRGCNCKKSHCLKKYCECFQAGVGCSDGCRCENCKNVHGRKEGAHDFDESDLQMEAVVGKELTDDHNGKSEYCAELFHGSQHQNVELSPTTPAFQHGGQHRPVTKTSLTIKKRGSLEAFRSPAFSLSSVKPCRSPTRPPRSPSRLLRSCKGTQNSPPLASTGVSLPKAGGSPATTPRIMRIGQFSPRWDGLDEICTLTPGLQAPLRPTPASASVLDRAELSPSVDEQNCNELTSTGVRQSSKFTCLTSPSHQQSSQCLTPANTQDTPQTRTPYSAACSVDNKALCEDSKAYVSQLMEDDSTPDFLKDPEPEYLPVCLLNSSSPKHKRVSPPHHHALREASHRGLQSPGVRSSRKFILQSIPAVPPTPFISVHEKPNGSKSHTTELEV